MRKIIVVVISMCLLFLSGCIEEDTTPPDSTKELLVYGTPLDYSGEWVSSNTTFTLVATDNESGVDATYYRIWYNGTWTSWITYTLPFTLSGTGMHYLEYYSVDNVGNKETVHNQTHYVDSTPPETEKIIGYGMYTVIYCSKIYFDGNETLNCTKLVISPIYETVIHCKSITAQEVQFIYYDVGKLEEYIA